MGGWMGSMMGGQGGWGGIGGFGGALGGVWMFLMGIVPLVVLGVLVWLVVESVRRRDEHPLIAPPALPAHIAGPGAPYQPGALSHPGAPTARAILDERYARGEIDREEYLQRRQDLAG